jgi:hypothetical protein
MPGIPDNRALYSPSKEELDLSERATQGAHLRSLRLRYTNNKQVLTALKEYWALTHTLRREYRGRDCPPELMAHFIVGEKLAKEQLDLLREIQFSLEVEINELVGQHMLGDDNV